MSACCPPSRLRIAELLDAAVTARDTHDRQLSNMSELDRAVEIMDRLRSPGGCPWDAAQTHASLAKYLLEETYELLEAIETDDLALLREELGDCSCRCCSTLGSPRNVPARRHLVSRTSRRISSTSWSGGTPTSSLTVPVAVVPTAMPSQLNERWEQQKITEKGRTSATDGVPLAQPALALAAKLVSRANRAGLDVEPGSTSPLGAQLFALVRGAVERGEDPESALRETVRAYRASMLAAEAAGSA